MTYKGDNQTQNANAQGNDEMTSAFGQAVSSWKRADGGGDSPGGGGKPPRRETPHPQPKGKEQLAVEALRKGHRVWDTLKAEWRVAIDKGSKSAYVSPKLEEDI